MRRDPVPRSASERMAVAERGVDHRASGTAATSSAGPIPAGAALGEQPIVGRGIQLEDRGEVAVVVGDAREHALAAQQSGRGPGGACRARRSR